MIIAAQARYQEDEGFIKSWMALEAEEAPRSGSELLRLEERALALGREIADAVMSRKLRQACADASLAGEAEAMVRGRRSEPLRGNGSRSVSVRLASGGKVDLDVGYLIVDRRRLPGRRRGLGRRGASGSGSYPVLERLGIEKGATPLLREMCVEQMVLSHSFEAAATQLLGRGVKLCPKALENLGQAAAGALVQVREAQALEAPEPGPLPTGPLAGHRVMVSADGGRVKTRRPHRQGRRKKNGRRGVVPEWREPRGFYIAILDENGRPHREHTPWLDASIRDADGLVQLLAARLIELGVAYAAEVVVIADGATWFWDRLDDLLKQVGLDGSKVTRVLDFYHACEYLTKALDLCRNLKAWERRELFKKLRRLLRGGQLKSLFSQLRDLARGRRARDVNKAIAYLRKRKAMLRYDLFDAQKLPLGSGPMESAIRRMINLRFKGPSIMWRVENVERLLHVRALALTRRLREAFLATLKTFESESVLDIAAAA